MRKAGPSIEKFFTSGVHHLKSKLGPILWQFATHKKYEPDDFAAFLDLLPKTVEGLKMRHAIEVRHESFLVPEFIALLRKHNAAIVYAHHDDYAEAADVTADFVYARLHRLPQKSKPATPPPTSRSGRHAPRIGRRANRRRTCPSWPSRRKPQRQMSLCTSSPVQGTQPGSRAGADQGIAQVAGGAATHYIDAMNAPTTEPLVLTARDGHVLKLTLNRPNARNALSEGLMAALQNALDAAAKDDSRVIVLAAEGPAFCSGHDLKEMTAHRKEADAGKAAFAAIFAQCSKLMQTIVRHPKPVIAQVQGIATAAGCQLVASCDLAVASANARFATPGVNIGLFCSTPMVALSRNVSRKHAMEMLLTGDMISANQAYHMAIVNRVVTHETLEAETMALAQQIASKPRTTVKIGKEAFYRQLEMPLSDAYDYTSKVMTENMLHAEANEGICAFVEKRDPKWPE